MLKITRVRSNKLGFAVCKASPHPPGVQFADKPTLRWQQQQLPNGETMKSPLVPGHASQLTKCLILRVRDSVSDVSSPRKAGEMTKRNGKAFVEEHCYLSKFWKHRVEISVLFAGRFNQREEHFVLPASPAVGKAKHKMGLTPVAQRLYFEQRTLKYGYLALH